MTDEGLGAVLCLTCEATCTVAVMPDACFQCGARFDRAAPALLVVVTVEVTEGLAISVRPEVRRFGVWGPELAGVEARLREGALRLVE